MFAKKMALIALLGVPTFFGALLLLKRLATEDTPSGVPRKHPEEIQELYDCLDGVFRAVYPDGSDEMICGNGARRPLHRKRVIIRGPRWTDDLQVGAQIRALPEWAFPVMATMEDRPDAVALIYRLETGEILWPVEE